MRILPDPGEPSVGVELPITQPLPDFDLLEVEAATPRDVDPMLASQGFKDLLDEARAFLERELRGRGLEIVQLTGAICHGEGTHRPGVWLVLRESGAPPGRSMEAGARSRAEAAAEALRASLQLS